MKILYVYENIYINGEKYLLNNTSADNKDMEIIAFTGKYYSPSKC